MCTNRFGVCTSHLSSCLLSLGGMEGNETLHTLDKLRCLVLEGQLSLLETLSLRDALTSLHLQFSGPSTPLEKDRKRQSNSKVL